MSPLRVSYRSMTSGLSLALYLNSLVYHRDIFGSSSDVLAIFGHLRKFSENVRKRLSGVRNNFGKSSEIFGRWSEIFGKSSKTPSSACLYKAMALVILYNSSTFWLLAHMPYTSIRPWRWLFYAPLFRKQTFFVLLVSVLIDRQTTRELKVHKINGRKRIQCAPFISRCRCSI